MTLKVQTTGAAFVAAIENGTPGDFRALTELLNVHQESMVKSQQTLAQELDVSDACASDILYLRTRSRHTQALEEELIRLHRAGTPPNMCDFGVTKETQAALMKKVDDALTCRGSL